MLGDEIVFFSFFDLMFQDENTEKTIISHGRVRKNQDDSHENSRGREFPLSFETNSQLTSVLHISGLGVGPASCNEASVLVFIFSIVCCYVFVAIHFSLFNYGFLSANLRYTAVGC